MKVQDVATLLIGAAAFILSVVTAVNAWVHQQHETEQNLREQLTDVINKLGDVDSQQIGLAAQAQAAQPASTFPIGKAVEAAARALEVNQRNSELNQLRAALAGQAAFLMERIESRVTAVESNTVAMAFMRTGNVPKAHKYFQLSIEKSMSQDKDPFLQALATRGYAAFLFGLNDPSSGREQFREARRLLDGDQDYLLAASVTTLQMWAYCEAFSGSMESSTQLLKDAADSYQRSRVRCLRRSRRLPLWQAMFHSPPRSPWLACTRRVEPVLRESPSNPELSRTLRAGGRRREASPTALRTNHPQSA